jgi:hypothetical protein
MIATVCGELEYDAACAMRDTAAIGNLTVIGQSRVRSFGRFTASLRSQ